jgi:hypothetical protein
MRTAALLLAIWGVGLGLGGLAGPAMAARQPVVVELFTAQGCSSCLGSNKVIADLADDPHVVPLTFAVDYWDYLGWADTFAKPEFTGRQRAYMAAFALREIYTPQLVVDGRLQVAALPLNQAEALVRQAEKTPRDPPDIVFRTDKTRVLVGVGKAPRGGADVWLIRYDPRDQQVVVKTGENRGKTVGERNVVRELERLGAWSGRSKAYRLPAAESDGLRQMVIVQTPKGGKILAAKLD